MKTEMKRKKLTSLAISKAKPEKLVSRRRLEDARISSVKRGDIMPNNDVKPANVTRTNNGGETQIVNSITSTVKR